MNPFIRIIPPALVRFFARPYVAGDSIQKALDTATELWLERGLLTTLDLLAEDIESEEQVERNFATYVEMIERCAAHEVLAAPAIKPTLSCKLSSYTTQPLEKGGDASGSWERMHALAARAQEADIRLTIDMESRHWTDFTLDVLRRLHRQGFCDVGAVIQTRLKRSDQDLDALPEGCRVRLVIGIYNESEEVAYTDKEEMKSRMLQFAERLLLRGHYVELGTHDVMWIQRFLDEVVPRIGVTPEQFEVQMLYGVPRDGFLRTLRGQGITARLYVPFATGWPMAIAYLRRRLDEYPAMMFLVARNLFAGDG